MTLDELLAREAIRHTLAAYNMAGDGRQPEAFAAAFAEEARFRSAIFDLRGRAAVHAWFAARCESTGPVRLVRHNLGTCLITLDGVDAADVRTYFTVFSDAGPDHGGRYVDRFIHAGERWLIAEREIILEWTRADSRLVPEASRRDAVIVGGG